MMLWGHAAMPLCASVGATPNDGPGLLGNYGFLSCATLYEQPEADIRARVAVMAEKFWIREFQFYDWFADYSTPVRGETWCDPYFRRRPISRRTIEVCLDEIHKRGGRAWAYVQAVGAEERDLADTTQDIQRLRGADGDWYWHPPSPEQPRFPTYLANAAWAGHQVERWAGPIKQLGFDGIHWDTLGRIAGDYGAETAGIHAFLRQARGLLAPLSLKQTMNFVDLEWWDPSVVLDSVEFPYAECWKPVTAQRYFAEMDAVEMRGRCGVFAMYPSVDRPAGCTESQVLRDRWKRARQHHLVYLIVGDGARRMKKEYWPETVALTEDEVEFLSAHR